MSTTDSLIAQLTAEAKATGQAIGHVVQKLVSSFGATSTAIDAGDAQAVEARLQSAIDANGSDIASLQGLNTALQSAQYALADRVTAVETRLTSVEGRVGAVETDVAGIKSDLAAVAVATGVVHS